jgi:hypothetical protein
MGAHGGTPLQLGHYPVVLGFAFEEDVGEGQAYSGKNEAVESVREDCHTSEIRILPESIEHRVIKPVIMTEGIEIEESGACANGHDVGHVLVPQQYI